METFYANLSNKFPFCDLDCPLYFLGHQLSTLPLGILLHKTNDIADILSHHDVDGIKYFATPMTPSTVADLHNPSHPPLDDPLPYQQLLNSLHYLHMGRGEKSSPFFPPPVPPPPLPPIETLTDKVRRPSPPTVDPCSRALLPHRPQGNVMADQHHLLDHPQSLQIQQQRQSPGFPSQEMMLSYVAAMEAALLPCLPARELQAIDRTTHSSHQIDVERHARDFMEAAKKLQLHFISLQYGEQPSEEEMLQKEIDVIEEELKTKSELINRHKMLIEGWEKELNEQLDKHIVQSEKV